MLLEEKAVGQAGQTVIIGQKLDFLLIELGLGNILTGKDNLGRRPVFIHQDGAVLPKREFNAIGSQQTMLKEDPRLPFQGLFNDMGHGRPVIWIDQIEKIIVGPGAIIAPNPHQSAHILAPIERVVGQTPLPIGQMGDFLGRGQHDISDGQITYRLIGSDNVANFITEQQRVDRFDNKICGPAIESLIDRLIIILACEHDYRHPLPSRQTADTGADFKAIDVRHHDIKEDGIRHQVLKIIDRIRAVLRFRCKESGL